MPPPENQLKSWHQEVDGTKYLCSTDPKRVSIDALGEALGSDMLWWAKELPREDVKTMVDQSLCFGLYVDKTAASGGAQGSGLEMVGFARVVTDYVTFGYLTDVYVLEEHQGKGLGRWVMRILDDVISGWPRLRGFILLSSGPRAVAMYDKAIGARPLAEAAPHLVALLRSGPGFGANKD